MADLHIVNTLQGFTQVPRDRYVNTFNLVWLGTPPVPDIDHAATAGALAVVEQFYDSLAPQLSPVIGTNAVARAYRWQDSEPRVPLERFYQLPARQSAGLPEEVSFALGFRGAPPHTRNRRGRIYIGPLGTAWMTNATASAFSSFSQASVNSALAAAQGLGSALFSLDWGWCVSNRQGTSSVLIAEFSYDLSPDTQRRRGWTANQRTFQEVSWAF